MHSKMAERSFVTTLGVTKAEIIIGLQSQDSEANLDALDKVTELGPGGAFAMGYTGYVAELLSSENEDVSLAAAEVLGQLGEAGAEYSFSLVSDLNHPDAKKRCIAVAALGMMGEAAKEQCNEVAKLLDDSNDSVRASACVALGNMKADAAATDVAKRLTDKFSSVVSGAISALTMFDSGEKYEGDIANKLNDKDKDVRVAALMYFTKYSSVGTKKHADAICKLVADEDSAVRETAVGFFKEVGGEAPALLENVAKLLSSQDIRFKASAALALGNFGSKASKYGDAIAALLEDVSEDRSQLIYTVAGIERKSPAIMRIPACASGCALAQIAGDKYQGQIQKLLNSRSSEAKMAAVIALGDIGASCEDALCVLLDDGAPRMRASAACALGKISQTRGASEKVADRVAQGLVDDSPIVKAACATAIGQMGDEGAAFSDPVHDLFEDTSAAVRAAAVQAMGGIGIKGQTYAAHVARMLADPTPVVRTAAVETLPALGRRGGAFADEASELLYDQDSSVRLAASNALAKLGDVGQGYLAGAGVPLAIGQ